MAEREFARVRDHYHVKLSIQVGGDQLRSQTFLPGGETPTRARQILTCAFERDMSVQRKCDVSDEIRVGVVCLFQRRQKAGTKRADHRIVHDLTARKGGTIGAFRPKFLGSPGGPCAGQIEEHAPLLTLGFRRRVMFEIVNPPLPRSAGIQR